MAPAGLADTSAIDDLLRTYVAQARTVADFDRLPIPYRAVATDMVTGNMVVLKEGDLATAMRASMAIPGAFAPVIFKDYILTDGGQVRNIPVDVARETCADVVIVVNLVEPPTPREKLVQATQLLARSMEVMLEANETIQLATLTDQDLRIDVYMGDIGTADFPRVPDTIPLGEQAARKVVDKLARYSVAPAEYVAWRERVTMHQAVDVRVAQVRFEGLEKVNPEYLRSRTQIQPGDDVTIDTISSDAMRMAVLDDVESVAYGSKATPRTRLSCGCPTNHPSGTTCCGRAWAFTPAAPATTSSCLASSTYGTGSTTAEGSGETPCRWVTRRCSGPVFTSRSTWPSATSWNRRCLLRARSKMCTWMAMPSRFTDSSTLEVPSNSASMLETPPSSGSVM